MNKPKRIKRMTFYTVMSESELKSFSKYLEDECVQATAAQVSQRLNEALLEARIRIAEMIKASKQTEDQND